MKRVERHRYERKEVFETRALEFEPYPMSEIDMVMKLIRDNLTPDLLGGRKSLMYPKDTLTNKYYGCLLYTSPSPRDATLSRMPSSA